MQSAAPSHDVTVIGLGAMGGALARALVAAGHDVVVWNRSPEKARALAEVGADVAASPAAAIAASPITLICLWDYATTDAVLATDGVEAALAGKAIVQLTTGNADEAARQGEWIEARDAVFLAGGILCFPRAVGAPGTVFLYSGDPDAFRAHAELLGVLAPAQRHVGARHTDVATVYLALWTFYFSAIGGFLDGLALIAASAPSREGVNEMIALTTDTIAPMAGKIVEGALDVIARLEARNFSGEQAPVASLLEGLGDTAAQIREQGLEPRMLEAFLAQLRVAADLGRGDEDVAAVAESLMPQDMRV